ncbi:hypothetical protein B0T10DRAFT_571569 [Thelonectria olida]|uniref:Uncharacterized protein n=1 Tax=Thelonectria olida TaxID=1576542 RepID=A0A9P8W3U6_9HYPO|nr:hypothetical protein B0T10DRAFT_571569 [Thelonectria olida]
MRFQLVASAALAASVSAVSPRQPYKLSSMPVAGVSFPRRDAGGYSPRQGLCGEGSTCADACGDGYTICPSNNPWTQCYNPTVQQTCCPDGTGNSCEKGYYCTHDAKSQTWCCPDKMDLAQCAAAYNVTGGLEKTTGSGTNGTTSKPTPVPVSGASASAAGFGALMLFAAGLIAL